MDAETAWRTVSLIPAGMSVVTGVLVYFISDDSPTSGKKHRRSIRRSIVMQEQKDQTSEYIARSFALHESKDSVSESFVNAAKRPASWILSFHYMVSFGVELTMLGSVAKYFTDEFGLANESASAVASIFGWMNLFARGMGGWFSDKANARVGMKGRIGVHALFLGIEGALVILLPFMQTFGGALAVMIFFSIAVQAAEGTCFGIVPYVDINVGAVSGIVSSGGNIGGIVFTSFFLFMEYNQIFITLGICTLASIPFCKLLFNVGNPDGDEDGLDSCDDADLNTTEVNGKSTARKASSDEDLESPAITTLNLIKEKPAEGNDEVEDVEILSAGNGDIAKIEKTNNNS